MTTASTKRRNLVADFMYSATLSDLWIGLKKMDKRWHWLDGTSIGKDGISKAAEGCN